MKNIDAVKMTNFYGEDWKALFERNERQKLTDKDHQLLQRLNESNADYVSVVLMSSPVRNPISIY